MRVQVNNQQWASAESAAGALFAGSQAHRYDRGMSVFDDMRRYANSGDRASPLVFVGRQRELERLDATIVNVAENGTEGATSLVYGVPGAGKTALARELAKRWAGRLVEGRPVCVVRLGVGALDARPRQLAATLLRHLPRRGGLPAKLQTVVSRAASTTVAALSRKSSVEVLNRSLGLAANSGLGDCLQAYGSLWAKDVTIVLAVDEFQAVPITAKSRALVRELHENIGNHRIVLLAFGLQNAMDVLCDEDGLSLSRLTAGAGIPLNTLAPGEGRELILRTMQALGLQWQNDEWRDYVLARGFGFDDWQQWSDRLVCALDRETENFPHHVTNAVRAVCNQLLRDRRSFSPTRDLINEMLAELNGLKGAYYDTRLGPLQEHSLALGSLCSRMIEHGIDAVMKTDARTTLATANDDGDEVKLRPAKKLLAKAIRRGIFTPAAGHGGLAVTIPSMSSYLGDTFEKHVKDGDAVALAIRGATDLSRSASRYGEGR